MLAFSSNFYQTLIRTRYINWYDIMSIMDGWLTLVDYLSHSIYKAAYLNNISKQRNMRSTLQSYKYTSLKLVPINYFKY